MCCQLKMQGSEQQRLNTSHTRRLFLGLEFTPAPSLPHSPEGGEAPGTVLSHYHQLYPAAPSSIHFSTAPEWDPTQGPQSCRINLLPEGLYLLQEISTCPSAGPEEGSAGIPTPA